MLEIVTLTISKAYARFKCEAHACNLRLLCTGWATSTVQCIVLDPKSIRVAHELVHLSVGNLGILRQIRDSDGAARFCRRVQLGTTEIELLITGGCRAMHVFPDLALIPGCHFVRQVWGRSSRVRWRSS